MMIALWVVGGVLVLFALTAFTGAPYVPSHRRDIQRVFREGVKLTKDDVVLDIGAGDGVVLIEAAKLGAQAIGYEINPLLVLVARWRTRNYRDNVQVIWANAWRRKPLERVTVLYAFGDGRDIRKMYALAERQARAQRRALTFVSYGFSVPGVEGVACGPYILFTLRQP